MPERHVNLSDETDNILGVLVPILQVGRGRIIGVAIEVLARFTAGEEVKKEQVDSLLEQMKNDRTFIDSTQDALEIANTRVLTQEKPQPRAPVTRVRTEDRHMISKYHQNLGNAKEGKGDA